MNCQNCGAPMRFDQEKIYFKCDYCTSIYFPEESRDGIRISDEESQLSCPICNLPLVLAFAEKIRVFYCNKCRGTLINQYQFLEVIQYIRSRAKEPPSIPPPLRREELARKILCPQCRRKMDTHPYGGAGNIVIDNCPNCRLNWLDHNELYRVTHSPDRGAREDDRKEFYERLFRSKKKSKDW
jgi:Zn-finger nucleic acid-binding protein